MRKWMMAAVAAASCCGTANASGSSGVVTVASVSIEGGSVYLNVTGGQNPDGCGSATIVALSPVSPAELDRMLSVALTARASGSKVSMWYNGCVGSSWGTLPAAVSLAITS